MAVAPPGWDSRTQISRVRKGGGEERSKQPFLPPPSSMALRTTTLFLHLLPKHSFPPVVCLYSTATGERREKGQFRSRSESFPPLEHRWEEEEEEEEAARKTREGDSQSGMREEEGRVIASAAAAAAAAAWNRLQCS